MQPLSSLLPKPEQIGDIIAKFEVGSTQQSTGYIKVYNQSGIVVHHSNIGLMNKPDSFLRTYGSSVDEHDWLTATIIPTRTGNWKDFAKDLFLPTLINQAIEIDDLAIAIFASIAALILDLITLIPRIFIAAPIKCIYDHYNPKIIHPLTHFTNSDDSQLKIEIYKEDIKTVSWWWGLDVEATAQRINWWVRTKAKPEDKKTRGLQEETIASFMLGLKDNRTWEYRNKPLDGYMSIYTVEEALTALNKYDRLVNLG